MSIFRKDYYHLKVPGDGDCFFHSISEAIHLNKYKKQIGDKYYTFRLKDKGKATWSKNSDNLRKKCVSWMEKNLQTYVNEAENIQTAIEDAIQNDRDKYPDIPTYLTKMSKQGEYGGQPEIYALSYILQKNIITYVDSGKDAYKTYGGGLSNIYNVSSPTIYLYHNVEKVKSSGGHHFEVLYPKKEAKIIKMDVYIRSSGHPDLPAKKVVSKQKNIAKISRARAPIDRRVTGKRVRSSRRTTPRSRKATPRSRTRKAAPRSRTRKATPRSRTRKATPRSRKAIPRSRKATPRSRKATPRSRKATPRSRKATPRSRIRKATPRSRKESLRSRR
jgi:hypothetical protein